MEVHKRVARIIQSLPLEHKVGQLFMLAFPGKNPEILFPLLQSYLIGGCYISQDNAENPDEAEKLTSALQEEIRKQHAELPLLLGVDQEGAWGVLIPYATIGPGNLALGQINETDSTQKIYAAFAQEMSSVGYHCILGPCADINLNPRNPIIGTRSFGEDPQKVCKHVDAAIRGIHQGGAIATAKHFPGHGDTQGDSHRELPAVDKDLATLWQQELAPFRQAVQSGVDILMSAHIHFPALDAKNPATLSAPILNTLIRQDLGFTGLIMTDSMNMGAMRRNYGPGEASLLSLQAGADIIMLAEEHYDHSEAYLEKQIESIEALIAAVKQGDIPESLIDERLSRIIHFKLTRLLPLLRSSNLNADAVTQSDDIQQNDLRPIQSGEAKTTAFHHTRLEEEAARKAVTVLRNTSGLWPIDLRKPVALVNATPRSAYEKIINNRGIGPNQATPAFDSLRDRLLGYCPSLRVFDYEQKEELYVQADAFNRILLVTEDYPLPGEDFPKDAQRTLVYSCIQQYRDRLVVVGLRSPYELEEYVDLDCYVSAFSSRTCSAEAMAWVIANPET